ncbi:MAG: hypothetical protein JNK45_13995 [Myxococcales bacterium]|nr:hypothetical protein [Myxococcales bacterium]
MRPTTITIRLFSALAATLAALPAQAADISSAVGPVGTASWAASCPGPQSAPGGTSQLPACPGGGSTCLHRVVIDPLEFPDATCSDGTPGVFYVRPGSGGDEDRWVIHLQGGGACRDYDECLERWCGQQSIYSANKMSSDWNADGTTDLARHVHGPGMASASATNEFSTWTHVWAYYCSSDSWQGTESDVEFTDGVDTFYLDAQGHNVLRAMRNMLRKRNSDPLWTAADGYSVGDLDDATEIVFTGTSAGAQGAVANADWFLAPFPAADRSLVVDANFDLDDWLTLVEDFRVDYDLDGVGDDWWSDEMMAIVNDQWASGGYLDRIGGVHDETCMDLYYASGRMDRCEFMPVLFTLNSGNAGLIETPTFVRLDLADNVLSDVYTQHPNKFGTSVVIGPGFAAPTTTISDFIRVARATLIGVFDDHDSVTGLFAPRCGAHVGLEDGPAFGLHTTPDTDEAFSPPMEIAGTDMTFHDALWEWLNVGGGGTRVDLRRVDTDEPGVAFSGC